MSGFNNAAWMQYHQGRRLGTIPPPDNTQPRRVCRCCGLLMTLEWDRDIFGDSEPIRYGYVDPSDDVVLNREERGPR